MILFSLNVQDDNQGVFRLLRENNQIMGALHTDVRHGQAGDIPASADLHDDGYNLLDILKK